MTYLQFSDAPDARPPGQPADDFSCPCEWVELDLMRCCPAVLPRALKHRLFIGNICVFERELADAEVQQRLDILPDCFLAIHLTTRHDTGGPHRQRSGGLQKVRETRGSTSH